MNTDFCKPKYTKLIASIILVPILTLVAAESYAVYVVMSSPAKTKKTLSAEQEKQCTECALKCGEDLSSAVDTGSIEYAANAVSSISKCINQCAGFTCE